MTAGVAHPVRVPAVQVGTRRGRWILVACVLGSALAGIDAWVVNVALPALWGDLHAPFAVLQWTVTAYTLTLALLILLGGATGDRYWRRRMFLVGVVWSGSRRSSALWHRTPRG
jgi:MFS family permease